MNFTENYPEKRAFEKYDKYRYALYLNEQAVDYTPLSSMESNEKLVSGFSYTGTQPDGTTLIEASKATYANFVSGLIRSRYSSDAVEAINSNMILALQLPQSDRAVEFMLEHGAYQSCREACKAKVRLLFPSTT